MVSQHRAALSRLAALGLCTQVTGKWHIRSELLHSYVCGLEAKSDDEIWLDRDTGELYQGPSPLKDLAPLERELLRFLVFHPLIRHTKTDLILNAWPDEPYPLERSDDSVYQVIRGLRIKIEPDPSKPRYIVTWRGVGTQEGGYQFFPEGR
jgi:DNA-binding response OmpR family regulator